MGDAAGKLAALHDSTRVLPGSQLKEGLHAQAGLPLPPGRSAG
jgi:hypothetical protein